jgi:hypothetical protein
MVSSGRVVSKIGIIRGGIEILKGSGPVPLSKTCTPDGSVGEIMFLSCGRWAGVDNGGSVGSAGRLCCCVLVSWGSERWGKGGEVGLVGIRAGSGTLGESGLMVFRDDG